MGTTQVLRFMRSVVLVGLGSLVGGSVVGAYAEVLFVVRGDFGVGGRPFSVTVGDFNTDGRPDLATANPLSDNVTVLLGQGDGTFQVVQIIGVGGPISITVGDFNGDGRPDLATCGGPDAVSVLLNTSPTVVNAFVTFVSLPDTFETSLDPTSCPAGFVGTFRFRARLMNQPTSLPLVTLVVEVTTLTNGNLLQNAEGSPGGVGARLPVPRQEGFADGVLDPEETVEVFFVICLRQLAPFELFVDVLGAEQE